MGHYFLDIQYDDLMISVLTGSNRTRNSHMLRPGFFIRWFLVNVARVWINPNSIGVKYSLIVSGGGGGGGVSLKPLFNSLFGKGSLKKKN